jgi:thiol:disulfide interchange protein DsbD
LLIPIFVGPEALNRLSTNWIANTLFFLIFVAFAFSFFGYYEITLPSSWSTGSDRMADKGGLIGIFFMAFTLALVSFSCTGPLIGTAIVQAATKGEYFGPFLVMLGFAFGLALPFGLFAAFPSWLNSLPRSGSWMNSVKVVLGFLELALALKFLSVADMTNGWGFLKYELFMALWIVIFLAMAAYLFGLFKFPHDSPVKKLSKTRIAFASLSVLLVLYLLTGFRINKDTGEYNALAMMSGLAPPTNYNFFNPPQALDASIKERYPSYSKCANNINCFKDYFEGINYAKEVGKPVMIDFTGYGCVNCRKTEEHIWVDDNVRRILNDSLVLISLYVDDDKKLSPVFISENSCKKLRNVGNKWADFQIVNFEQNSQPLYVIATNDQKVMSRPRPFVEGISGYLDYLECNLEAIRNFEQSQK